MRANCGRFALARALAAAHFGAKRARRHRANWYFRRVINFNHLYYFHVTATEGTLREASRRLGVTQSTVSEQIRLLERSLGVKLFERAASGLRLTQAGRDALEHTSTMFRASERLAEAVGQIPSTPEIVLRVGVSAAVSRTVAAAFLMPVLSMDPCRPSIRTGDFAELVRDLRSHELDLVIGEAEPVPPTGLEVTMLHRPTLVAVTSSATEPKEDWTDLSLVEYRTSSPYHWEVDAFLRDRGLRPTSAGEVDDAFLMMEAVARGGFVAFVPFSVARERLERGDVKKIASVVPSSAIHAVFQAHETLHLARTAVEKLVENARLHFDV